VSDQLKPTNKEV